MEQLCILSSMAQVRMLQTSLSVMFNSCLLIISNKMKLQIQLDFFNCPLSRQICSSCMIVCNLFFQMADVDSDLVVVVVLLLLNIFYYFRGTCVECPKLKELSQYYALQKHISVPL